jgi:hypothetical protein
MCLPCFKKVGSANLPAKQKDEEPIADVAESAVKSLPKEEKKKKKDKKKSPMKKPIIDVAESAVKSLTKEEKKNKKNKKKSPTEKPRNASAESSSSDEQDRETEYDCSSSGSSSSDYEVFDKVFDVFEEDTSQQNETFMKNLEEVRLSKQLPRLGLTDSLSPSSANTEPNSLQAEDGGSQPPAMHSDGGSQPLDDGGSKPPAKIYAKLLSEARSLDNGEGGELSGEPAEGFVHFMASILPKGYHLDLGCATGVYLVLIKELRPDLEIAGVEKLRTRCNMAMQLHALAGFKTQISQHDILKLDSISEMITSVFMHDTVWTHDVVEASTKLVLENASLEMVVTVQERPKLITEGSFVVDQTFDFTLRGGNTHKTALVYKRTRSTNVHQVRSRVLCT